MTAVPRLTPAFADKLVKVLGLLGSAHDGGVYSCVRESGGGGGAAGVRACGSRRRRLFQLQAECLGESGQVGAADVVTAVDVFDQLSRHVGVGDTVGDVSVLRRLADDQRRQFKRNAGQDDQVIRSI